MNTLLIFRYFIIAGLINVSLFTFLLLTRKKNNAASFLLIVFMLLVSFQALLNAFDTRAFFLAYPHLSRISWLLPSLFGPLVYLFTKKITSQVQHLQQEDGIQLLPFAFYFGTLSHWFFSSLAEKIRNLLDFDELSKTDFGWLNQLSILIVLFYLILTLRQLRNYRKRIENTFSELSTRRFEWIKTFVFSMLAILFVSALVFYGRKWNIPFLTNFYHYNYGLLLLLVYWMAYKCIIQPELYLPEKAPDSATFGEEVSLLPVGKVAQSNEMVLSVSIIQEKKYQKSGLDADISGDLYSKLLAYMDTFKPHLEPDLTIYKLAVDLAVPRHHLSQVINEKAQKTFFDFINAYRVEEVKKRLGDAGMANRNILGMALDSGFNSKATFNAAFKKFTGMTPSAYQKTHAADV